MNLKSSLLARAHVKNFMDLPHQSNIALIDWFLLLLWWKALTLRWPEKIVKSSLLVTFRNLKGRKLAPQNPLIKLGFESARLLVDQLHLMSKKDILSYLRISMQICGWPHWKNLTFLSYEFWKRQCTRFSPFKVALFAEKNQVKVKSHIFSVGLFPFRKRRPSWPWQRLTFKIIAKLFCRKIYLCCINNSCT